MVSGEATKSTKVLVNILLTGIVERTEATTKKAGFAELRLAYGSHQVKPARSRILREPIDNRR